MTRLKIRFASAFLIVLALSSIVTLVRAQLDIERPDRWVSIQRLLGKSNNDTASDAGVSLGAFAQNYVPDIPGQGPYGGDYVYFNVSMIANTRRGISYSWENTGITDYRSWIWNDFPAFGWQIHTNLANDSGVWVDLPVNFSFVFYGVKYLNWTGIPYASHVWISTNGFASLDNSNSTSTGPNAFPSPDAPNAVIAPFWTGLDFITGQSEIDTWISREYNRYYWFVVKWVNMHERGTGNFCTFGLSFRIYSRNVDGFDPIPDRNYLPSSDVWFFYNDLKTPATNFTYGLEDQTGCKRTIEGGTLDGSWATQFNGTAKLFYNVGQYVKSLKLTFQDSNPNGTFNINASKTFGRGLYTLPNPPKDSSLDFVGPLSQVLDWGLYVGDVVVGVGSWLAEGGSELWGLAPFFGPAGWVLLGAEGIKLGVDTCINWLAGHQYQPAQPSFGYNYVTASAFDNYTKKYDTVLDASLETQFAWVVGNDYSSNHNLTITAAVEYGRWDDATYSNTASTSVSVNLFPDNNNDVSHAQQVNYGFYGDNPLLYLGGINSYDNEDYYNLTVQNTFGTMVDICPSAHLELFVYVSDPNGQNITSSTIPGEGNKQEVRFVPSSNGNYTIRVHGVAGEGLYNLTASKWAVLAVSVNGYPPGAGNVNPLGVSWHSFGHVVFVLESPTNSSYYFIGWSVDGSTTLSSSYPFISYDGPYAIVTMNQNHALVAYFAQNSSSGGDSCPYVSTWNGSGYVLDNNLLPSSEYSGTADVTDYYLLQQTLSQKEDGTLSLLLSELEGEHDFFDSVQLVAVDHASNVNVAVSPSGQILTYVYPHPPASAKTNENKNVKGLLSRVDGIYYQGYDGSYVTLNFGDLDVSRGAKLVIRSDMIIVKCPVYIQTMNSAGQWQTVATIYVRRNWTTDIVDMSRYLPDARGSLKMRLLFTSNDKIDFVGLDTSPQARMQVHQGQLVSAVRKVDVPPLSFSENVTAELLSSDQTYAELLPGQEINLTFVLPPQTKKTRSYVIVAEGHYILMTP